MTGTSRPTSISTKQARIATLAKQMPQAAMHTLAHHMDTRWLEEALRRTRKDGAAGVDGQTAEQYRENLEDNLHSLLGRAKSGAYRAPPVRRVHIPKDTGKTRPIGIPTLEDKILQRAVVMLLEPIYEQDFYPFSYGFRPGKSAHDAVQALQDGLMWLGGGWVLDVDVQSFFDTLNHKELRHLLRRRVTDGVVTRLIGKWLRAGILENGRLWHPTSGTPQGGVISPLLANIYLHEVLDRWWVEQVQPRLKGKSLLVRYADDFVMAFTERSDAERVQQALVQRFARFSLILHPEKTRLLPFFRPSGHSKPGTFSFLGFTHYWGKTRRGRWMVKRKTSSTRFTRALQAIDRWMSRARHRPVGWQAAQLGLKLRGHFNYYGIRGNARALSCFANEVRIRWMKWLSRRSQLARMTWPKFNRLLKQHPLPPPRLRRCGRQLRLANL